jgi:uncharacterized protein (DUF58 family)
MDPPLPVPYILRWRPNTVAAGAHPSGREGSGGAFKQHASLLRHPDPRRIDLRVTLRDPAGDIHVRQFSQRSAVSLIALLDLTGSMGFDAPESRMRAVAGLCAVLAASAHKMGDRFGLIGCDARVREDVFVPATRRRGLDREVHALLMKQAPGGASAKGLIEGARRVPATRSLVFLMSDFLMPIALVERTLAALWRHDVIPLMFRERLELPAWGLLQLRDLESGRRRLILLRPKVLKDWQQRQEEHDDTLRQVFARHGRTPLRVFDRMDWDALARYLTAR